MLKSDPVTFATIRLGWHVVQANVNDVAVMGGRPCWFQPTVLLPLRSRVARVMAIACEIHVACRALGIAVTDGRR